MISCPYCRTPLAEASEGCPECQMTLAAMAKLKGAAPKLEPGLNDSAEVLKRRAAKQLRKDIADFCRTFPQIQLHVVISAFADDLPLPATLVWLFNEAGFCSQNDKGGKNFDLLIGINPNHRQAALVLGYGLEMIVPQDELLGAIHDAQPLLETRKWQEAISAIIVNLQERLATISQDLQTTIGAPKPFAVKKTTETF